MVDGNDENLAVVIDTEHRERDLRRAIEHADVLANEVNVGVIAKSEVLERDALQRRRGIKLTNLLDNFGIFDFRSDCKIRQLIDSKVKIRSVS